jgi:ribosomal protein S18 acetylase RimI-like enzyme
LFPPYRNIAGGKWQFRYVRRHWGEFFENGVRAVTLSGSEEAVELYRKLGFHDCFHNIIMQYDISI